jgi:hypothetical protein
VVSILSKTAKDIVATEADQARSRSGEDLRMTHWIRAGREDDVRFGGGRCGFASGQHNPGRKVVESSGDGMAAEARLTEGLRGRKEISSKGDIDGLKGLDHSWNGRPRMMAILGTTNSILYQYITNKHVTER